jgi:ornithine cyclodeaminase
VAVAVELGTLATRNDACRPVLRQLTADQVHAALPWPALVAALEAAFLVPPAAPPRHTHALSTDDTLLLMPAWSPAAIGMKLVTVIPTATAHGGRTVDASYLLLDRATGAPRALLDGEALTVRRTAATSALAARVMARGDAESLLVVGTGRLAPWMVRAHVALRPGVSRIAIWGRRRDAAEALVATLRADGIVVDVVADLAAAVAAADIVSCATTAREPVVHGAWLREGTHLDLVGGFTPAMREVDDEAVRRARVIVDRCDAALAEAGDLLQPLARGMVGPDHVLGELADVLRGAVQPRRDARDITLFKSVGHALEDLAAATLAVEAR